MKIKALTWLLIIVLTLSFLALPISAHSGKTDSRGGHYDSSTGEYHYHHGYSAHQHTNGKCPYDYDDKTSYNSNTSSTFQNSTNDDSYGFGDFIVTLLFVAVIIAIVFIAKNLLER